MSEAGYNGVFRAVVEDVNDPERRGRYRVRVAGLHADTVPAAHLPWAETCGFGGKGFGDFGNFLKDDLVWIMFEGGNRRYPVIMGGWLSRSQGIRDLPPEQTHDYVKNRSRWVRIDRAGNELILSELPEEFHVRLRSGDSDVRISRTADSVEVSAEGFVKVTSPQVHVDTEQAWVAGKDITLQAATDGSGKDAEVNLYSTGGIKVWAAKTVQIGQYRDGQAKAHQSERVEVLPEVLQLGQYGGEDEDTLRVEIAAKSQVRVRADSQVQVQAPQVNIDGDNEVKVVSSKRVSIQAPQVDITG